MGEAESLAVVATAPSDTASRTPRGIHTQIGVWSFIANRIGPFGGCVSPVASYNGRPARRRQAQGCDEHALLSVAGPMACLIMLELQENIAKVQSATKGLRRDLVDKATREYFSTLELIGSPAAGDFDAAEARAHAVLKQQLLSPDSAALINGGAKLDDDSLALLALGFDAIARPLRVAGPATTAETKSITLALGGAGGAIGGMLLLAALMRLAFDMRDLGLVLGAPFGALLAVLLVYWLTRRRFLPRILPWLFVRPKTLRGTVRREHERAVRSAVEQWVDWAVPMLAVLCLQRAGTPETQTDRDKALRRIGKLIYALHQAPAESLPVIAHELVQEAKNSGFEGLEGQPAFLDKSREEKQTLLWKQDLQTKYETFGHIGEGDEVTIERPAVVFGGKIVQRGLVRKVRGRT